MKVVIVARTRMKSCRCIGALGMGPLDRPSFRLLDRNGSNWPASEFPFKVGDVLDIRYTLPRNFRPPHMEDVLVEEYRHAGSLSPAELVSKIWQKHPPHEGDVRGLFTGKLRRTENGSLYLGPGEGVPRFSTQFWVPDEPLKLGITEEKGGTRHRYYYGDLRLAYVGEETPAKVIPAGTIVRVSLARWWAGDTGGEERCYLQLSGWIAAR